MPMALCDTLPPAPFLSCQRELLDEPLRPRDATAAQLTHPSILEKTRTEAALAGGPGQVSKPSRVWEWCKEVSTALYDTEGGSWSAADGHAAHGPRGGRAVEGHVRLRPMV